MISKGFWVKKPYVFDRSVKWANGLLRWFLREILYAETWIHHPYNKVIVAYDVIDQLEDWGYVWQARRVQNHLHRWMKSISRNGSASVGSGVPVSTSRGLAPRSGDTLDLREREVST